MEKFVKSDNVAQFKGVEYVAGQTKEVEQFLTTSLTEYGDARFEEGKQRREDELMIMLDEVEREGWDMTRFVNTFAELNRRNHQTKHQTKQTTSEDISR